MRKPRLTPVSLRVLDLLCTELYRERYIGKNMFSVSRFGVEVQMTPTLSFESPRTETHRDQFLAMVARHNLSRCLTIEISGQLYDVDQLLLCAMENFTLNQREISWSAIAFACFAPTVKWENRFGDILSLEEIAKELLERGISKACCGGVHRLIAISYVLESDEKHAFLTPETRCSCVAMLKKAVDALIKEQRQDGSWPNDWLEKYSRALSDLKWSKKPTALSRNLATTHVLEWLRLLPRGISFPNWRRDVAVAYLGHVKQDLEHEDYIKTYCPNLHILGVVDSEY